MYIKEIQVQNFRLLKDTTVDLEENLSLIIGKNNTGKTSFLILFEKFFNDNKFTFNDFSLSLRPLILAIDENTNVYDLAIRMIVEIDYSEAKSLANISELILDLDTSITTTKVLFECTINKAKLLKSLGGIDGKEDRERYIKKHLKKYSKSIMYVIDDESYLSATDREGLIEKDVKIFQTVVNFQIIHARREVVSSEANDGTVLSKLTTDFYNVQNKVSPDYFSKINRQIIEIDKTLDGNYTSIFKEYLKSAKDFLGVKDLKVISNLQTYELIKNTSKVIYGDNQNFLPEHLNGLGFMNILYVLLSIEIKKVSFQNDRKDINLLFLEEPEAHTHPQMQYVFAKEIRKILDTIKNSSDTLQTVVSTHSVHIVSQQEELFESIRYFLKSNGNIICKNFKTELKDKYEKENEFKFLKQYITLQASELFFADKIIFIEGTTERLLLPYFIKKFDNEKSGKDENYVKLSSQNLSILEVGANGKVFEHFLNFLGIKTLIITDIDTTRKHRKPMKNGKYREEYVSASVKEGTYTSNATITYFFKRPELPNKKDINREKKLDKIADWMVKLKNNNLQCDSSIIKVAYQTKEENYHGRSFEDSFISINFATIQSKQSRIDGLQNKNEINDFDAFREDYFKLTERILKSKSAVASSILYLALAEQVNWNTPQYIKNGLEWLVKN